MTETAIQRRFLLLHGWQNHRPAGHWMHWLADRLTGLGHDVDYPQLPDPDYPELDRWLDELRARLDASGGRELTVVCHSLGCMLWLHAVAGDVVTVPVERVLLIAPPSSSVLEQHPEITAFTAPLVTSVQISAAAKYTRIVGSDNDPYCPENAAAEYGEPLGLPADVLAGQAHLDMDAGYSSWPSLLDWCLAPSNDVPIQPRA